MIPTIRADVTREVKVVLTDEGRASLRALVQHVEAMAASLQGSPELNAAGNKLRGAAKLVGIIADGADTILITGASSVGAVAPAPAAGRPS